MRLTFWLGVLAILLLSGCYYPSCERFDVLGARPNHVLVLDKATGELFWTAVPMQGGEQRIGD